ncbi:MAG: hypothetical protein MI799_22725 [Desulfobacterales bacterium]|nr:hypothetical protein [Desulfobacterales bacterium]
MPTCTVICRDATVKQGQDAYLNGDYTLARQIFSQLALKEQHVRQQAAGRYGNACLDMILAENAPAFRFAVEKFLLLPSLLPCRTSTHRTLKNSGQKSVCNPWTRMPPGMLEKALAHGMVLLESERSGILEKLNTMYAGDQVYKKERLKMQKQIDSLGGKTATLEKQNMEQEARIADLLHQISVLERIDKERQEQRENQ